VEDMPKATLTLKSGATVTIEGSTNEIHRLLQLHDNGKVSTEPPKPEVLRKSEREETAPPHDPVPEIVNLIRSCDDAERIEKQILDKSNVVSRCLLPLYIIHQQLQNTFGLTTGQISAITKELGVPIFQPNVAKALAGPAGRFVMASRIRKRGVPVTYTINRRGVQHLEEVIKGQ
jgi:hypothetical protein